MAGRVALLLLAGSLALIASACGSGRSTSATAAGCIDWLDKADNGDLVLDGAEARAAKRYLDYDPASGFGILSNLDIEGRDTVCSNAADMGLVANDGSLPPLAMAILGSCTSEELDPHDRGLSPKERASMKKNGGLTVRLHGRELKDLKKREAKARRFERQLDRRLHRSLVKRYGTRKAALIEQRMAHREKARKLICANFGALAGPRSLLWKVTG